MVPLTVATCDILCDVMQLPAVDHERLPSPPLKAMLGQIRFPPVLRILDLSYIARFQEEVRAEYPELAEETQLGVLVGPTGPVQTRPSKQWRLSTTDGRWGISLAQNALTLEASAAEYTDYDEFRSRFAAIWPAAIRTLSPQRRVQQGLRYVNHIDMERAASEWGELINPQLLGAVGSTELGDDIEQAVSAYRFRRPDGTLILKHGIVRAGPEQKTGYLLDFDYFTQAPADLATDEVLRTFDGFHDMIYRFFRWCVSDRAVELFRSERGDL
jgi:uncharacterized protein (TIGR04255 family)